MSNSNAPVPREAPVALPPAPIGITAPALGKNAFRWSVVAAAIALTVPAGFIALLAKYYGWREARDPMTWAAWIPVFTALATMLLTAGYFLVTAALFQETARQAAYAATQAFAAASTAQVAVDESRLNRRATLSTIQSLDLQHRRIIQPLRNAITDRIVTLQKVAEELAKGRAADIRFDADEFKDFGNATILEELKNGSWLLPQEVRAGFVDAQERLKKLHEAFKTLGKLNPDRARLSDDEIRRLRGDADKALEIFRKIATLTDRLELADESQEK